MGASKQIDSPDDPDPTPITTGDTTVEVQQAGRQARKRLAKANGRAKTLLAGSPADSSAVNAAKKTILGD